jgi:hypothetical protein
MVRLHLAGDSPSIEGVFVGFWANHYVIRTANAVLDADRTVALEGPETRVHRDRVEFMQVVA